MNKDTIRAILVNGIRDTNPKAYFIIEYKKAEFYTVDDFFNPLFDFIVTWKKEIATKFDDEEKSLTERIERAKQNKPDRIIFDRFYSFCEPGGMSFEDFTTQENNKRLELLTREHEELTIDNYRIKHRTFAKPELTIPELTLLEGSIKSAIADLNEVTNDTGGTTFENKHAAGCSEFKLLFTEQSQHLACQILNLFREYKQKEIVYLLFALYEIGYLETDPKSIQNKSELHRRLSEFTKIGTIQGFDRQIKDIDPTLPYDKSEILNKIKIIKNSIPVETTLKPN